VKLTTFDMLRVWAALTGVALAVAYFVLVWLELAHGDTLPMLVAAIGGFEMVLFAQDRWLTRRAQRG
jgi:hypothetical protein